jgi:hypothetical protein
MEPAMSRRREFRGVPEGTVRFRIDCDGAGDHRVRPIAHITMQPRPQGSAAGRWSVGVEYVWHKDNPDNEYTWSFRDTHTVRRFVCGQCRRDVPFRDEHLVELVLRFAKMERRHARLRELVADWVPSASVTRE